MDSLNAVAIVGMGLRFPDARDKHDFWRNLRCGRDSVRSVDVEELKLRGARPQDLRNPNYVRRVSTIEGIDLFDAGFFSLTAREAQLADPQLRILLEVCYEAIEDCGHVLDGTRTGVYVGAADNDFWLSNLIYKHPDALGATLPNRIFIKKDYFATQLSHKLNLKGPSVSISTTCSTSLVAVHEAATHLLMYDCDFALAGGCEIDQGCGYMYEEGGILSKDGYCRAFSADANGTIFGSGCGILALRRYEDAVKDRDHIYAVVLSARINNDGRVKAGYTAPSVTGQAEVIYDAICAAGVSAEDITYVEAHGTGTQVGDPIEIESLSRAFERFTRKKGFCAIGSVKTNIGHLSVAAGVAGLVKTALALEHRELPASLHFDKPNPHIDFANSPFYVNTALRSWTSAGGPLIAAVSSFGVGGTNSHAVVQEAPPRQPGSESRPYQLLAISAKSREAMLRARQNLTSFLEAHGEAELPDVAYTLLTGRPQLAYRCALACEARVADRAILRSASWMETSEAAAEKAVVAFMFPGEGTQYVGMSARLYEQEAVFRSMVDQCAPLLESDIGLDIRQLIYPAAGALGRAQELLRETRYAQPALFVVSYALARLLLSWGLKPRYLIGHGIGEYVAACLAGVFSLQDCLHVVSRRGALMQAVDVLHSPMRPGVSREFAQTLQQVRLCAPAIGFISNVTGKLITAAEAQSADYWIAHLSNAVRFDDGLQTLAQFGVELFLELGPGTTLTTLVRQGGRNVVALLPPPETTLDDNLFLMRGLSEIWVAGVEVDWAAFYGNEQRNRLSLPTYPFQRKSYWFDPPPQRHAAVGALTRRPVHPLLGQRWAASARTKAYENFICGEAPGFLADHRLMNSVIFPGAGYAEMALAAARLQFGEQRPIRISRIQFERALMLDDTQARAIQTIISEDSDGQCSFEIGSFAQPRRSEAESKWVLHSSGSFCASSTPRREMADLAGLRGRINNAVGLEFYETESVKYGPSFRSLRALWAQGNEVLARIELPTVVAGTEADYYFHPVLLDACFQAIGGYSFIGTGQARQALPVALVNLDVWSRVPRTAWVHITIGDAARRQAMNGAALTGANITVMDDVGSVLASIERYERKELSPESLEQPEPFEELFYEIRWQAQDLPIESTASGPAAKTIILTDEGNCAASLAEALVTDGCGDIAIHDYSSQIQVDAFMHAELATRRGRAGRTEIVMMRVADVDVSVDDLCHVLLQLVQSVAADDAPRVTLAIVTRGCQSVSAVRRLQDVSGASLWGFGTAISKEYPALKCLRVDMDPDIGFAPWAVSDELRRVSEEDVVAYRGHTRYVARLHRMPARTLGERVPQPFKIGLTEFGTFDALRPQPCHRSSVGPDDVEVEIHAAGLNFKETLISLGMLDVGHANAAAVPLGFEGAGIVVGVGPNVTHVAAGDRVIVWANGCLASHVTTHKCNVLALRGSSLTFEQAASLPTVFMTAWFALQRLAKLRKGERVLIHAAAGGVGQAAIQIARAIGARIYATASRGKWEFLKRQGIVDIFDSRTTTFADEVLKATQGHGVDVVLNSLSGEFIPRSFDALARGGRFIEIGKLNVWTPERAHGYRPDIEYRAFELGVGGVAGDNLLEQLLRPTLGAMMSGVFEPPTLRVFCIDDIVPAFRWLAAGRNIGKAVIRVRPPCRAASGTVEISRAKQYLVTGGLGALGLHVAQWLAKSGAGEVVLLGRGEPNGHVMHEIARLRATGTIIRVATCDVGNREQLSTLLADLPQLAGIVHCAGVLDDGVIANQTRERFQRVLRPKVQGVRNLHDLTLERQLDLFVCFSSTSAMLDGAGQANYAAANAYLDAFVSHRVAGGRPGLSISWGAWSGLGMAAKLTARRGAADCFDKEEGLAALEQLVASGVTHAVFGRMRGRLRRERAPLFKELADEVTVENIAVAQDFEGVLRDHGSLPSVADVVRTQVRKVLGAEEIGDQDSFIEAGIDSLMLAELRNNVQKALSKPVPVAAFYANATVAALTSYIVAEHFSESAGSFRSIT